MSYCTLYTDGSGGSDWFKPAGNSPHKFHTLAGLIIDPKSDLLARDRVYAILNSYIPEETRNIRPDNEYELHYNAIKSARGIYRKIGKKERDEIIYKTFDAIVELKPIAIASTVDKVAEWQKRGENAILPQPYAMRSVVHKFSMHLNRLNKIGSVIYDEDKIQFNLLLQKAIISFRKNGIGIGPQRRPDRLDNILNNINFCPSHLSPGLQLADFAASAVWQKHERGNDEFYKIIEPLWEDDQASQKTYRDSLIS